MAQMFQGLTFTGSISNLSDYKMRGSDKIILRSKGGPSKKTIKNHPNFDMTRRYNAEFGGRAKATWWVHNALRPILSLADYNIAGPLNALVKPIQGLDITSELGRRSIHFTKLPGLLQGFQLNQRNPFDQIVRNPVTCFLSKKDCTAQIEIPALIPGINLFVPGKFPFFSISVVLGVLPDLDFDPRGYKPEGNYDLIGTASEDTAWHLVSKGAVEQSIQLRMKQPVPDQSFCLVLSVGIRFGNPGLEKVEQVKCAGAGKVLAVI